MAAEFTWNRNIDRSQSLRPVDPNEKLFLFGYSCKIFRDDEKSQYIDQGKHLIPWMGDKSLMIDRYDVRGYLHDLKPYEPDPGQKYEDPNSEEEKLCDEERYQALHSDLTEEQLYQEEELKRLRAAIASDGAYHEISFSYDNVENEATPEPKAEKVDEPIDELYESPPGLEIPKGMECPYNMKIHTIIEKTALFVSQQGGQMEIIIKMKQQANPQFGFMHLDNPLYPYYKHLVKEIKSGRYKPVVVKKSSRSEDEDDDGHYLHPSLMAGKAENIPKFTLPSINFRRTHDDSYSMLVRNLQHHIVEEANANSPSQQPINSEYYADSQSQVADYYTQVDASYAAQYDETQLMSLHGVVPPPPDVQPVIDKMAEYVAKNGEDFEFIVKSKNDKRFDFLHPWHEYYSYYIYKRNSIMQIPIEPNLGTSKQIMQSSPKEQEVNKTNEIASHPVRSPVIYRQECESSYSQDTSLSEPVQIYQPNEDMNESLGFPDSPMSSKDDREIMRSKHISSKIIGPISFSLKSKDNDTPSNDKSKLSSALLDDSEEEGSSKPKRSRSDSHRRRHEGSYRQSTHNGSSERDEKSTKMSDLLEAKLAEERIKDKLAAAARERIVMQKRDKLLQQERKRKAALFLKMLKTRAETEAAQNAAKSNKELGHTSKDDDSDSSQQDDAISPLNGIIFPSEKGNEPEPETGPVKNSWSSDNESEGPSNKLCSIAKSATASDCETKSKSKHNSKKKKHSHDKESSSKSLHKSKSRHRSRSPSKDHKKSKKEKVLPAAYALDRSSRSRSRSPRRYRTNSRISPRGWNWRRM